MKRQFPGNANHSRGDPRFSGGRGRGRGPMNPQGPGRGIPYRGTGGPPHMNGARGGGPMTSFPPQGRGPPQKFYGRGPGRSGMIHPQQSFHRNPPSNFQNHGPQGPPPPMRGGPPPGMMGRGRMHNANATMGYKPFNGGRGRGRGNMPGRNSFGARGPPQQRRPPPPFRGRGNGFPPPGSYHPSNQPGPPGNSPPFREPMNSQPPQYGPAPGFGNDQQQPKPPNGFPRPQQYQPPLQQLSPPGPVTQPHVPYPPQGISHQQPLSMSHSVNSNNFPAYPQGTTSASNSLPATIPTTAPRGVDESWKEYTAPNGVKYYHNELSKESTYEKPNALKKLESNLQTTVDGGGSSSKARAWQEHEDAATGKKYYSDGVQTTWEKPAGFVSPETIVANTTSGSKRLESNGHDGPASKKKKLGNRTESFASKKEASIAFKEFLLAKGISPSLKWNEVLKVCESDSKLSLFEEILSIGERRQALAEYQTKRANEIRNEQRQERVRAKEAFAQMLTEVLPSISGFSARSSRFSDVRDALAKDDRFLAIEEEDLRESLFLDFCDDFKKREERNKRNKKREIQKAFVAFLQEREEKGSLTYTSSWESFVANLSEEEKGDSRFATSTELLDSERKLYFGDFVDDLQKVEDEKRRRIHEERRRIEKAQRDKYREVLHELAVAGKIFPYSRWREIEDLLLADDSYRPVEDQDRGAPRELFEIFVEDWDGFYHRERSFLLRLLHPPGKPDVVIPAETSYDDFKTILTDEAEADSTEIKNETLRIIEREDPVSSARLLHRELTAQPTDPKRGSRRGSTNDDSSEDEGEIIEDGEITDGDNTKETTTDDQPETVAKTDADVIK